MAGYSFEGDDHQERFPILVGVLLPTPSSTVSSTALRSDRTASILRRRKNTQSHCQAICNRAGGDHSANGMTVADRVCFVYDIKGASPCSNQSSGNPGDQDRFGLHPLLPLPQARIFHRPFAVTLGRTVCPATEGDFDNKSPIPSPLA